MMWNGPAGKMRAYGFCGEPERGRFLRFSRDQYSQTAVKIIDGSYGYRIISCVFVITIGPVLLKSSTAAKLPSRRVMMSYKNARIRSLA